MPIVVSRKTGQILSRPNYTPEQIEKAHEAIVRTWAEANKEYLCNLGDANSATKVQSAALAKII